MYYLLMTYLKQINNSVNNSYGHILKYITIYLREVVQKLHFFNYR